MKIGAALDVSQVADPATPAAGRQFLYFKSDGVLYTKKSDGTVAPVNASVSSGGTTTTQVIDGGATPSETQSGIVLTGPPNLHASTHATGGTDPVSITTSQLTATGTRDETTFLRGDNVWSVPIETLPVSTFDAKGDVLVGSADNAVARLPVGTRGQTAIVDSAQTTGLKYVAICEPYIFSVTGALSVTTGKSKIVLQAAYEVESIHAYVNTAPTGASVIVDVFKNGTTLFTTQANRPTISAGANSSTNTLPDVIAFASGDILSVDVSQVGSTVAGSDLTVTIRLRRI